MSYDFDKLLNSQHPFAYVDVEWDQGKEMIRLMFLSSGGKGYYGSFDKKNAALMIDLLKWYHDQMI